MRSGYDNISTRSIPIVKFDESNFMINNGTFYDDMFIECKIQKAKKSVDNFIKALYQVKHRYIVKLGELLCIDNRVIYHSREPFTARYDEKNRAERWVQRLFVTDNIDNFYDWEKISDRVYLLPAYKIS